MSKVEALRKAKNLEDLAKLLNYEAKSLSYIIYVIPDKSKYATFTIPKKNGGQREIKSPVPRLKKLQKTLAKFLENCVEEYSNPHGQLVESDSYGGKRRPSNVISHGFQKGLSIKTNAEKHLQKRYVFNLDIEGFFPSINYGRVRGFFIKDRNFGLDPKIATILAKIICHNNELPQGSPCSPIMSNLIGRILDVRLARIAKRSGCNYSRYADDLTFSTNLRLFPAAIGCQLNGEWIVGKELEGCIKWSGFKINKEKTRMQFRTSRQQVTGLVVNSYVNVPSEYYRDTRTMCNQLFKDGSYFHRGSKDEKIVSFFEIEGRINYIYSIKSFRNWYARPGYRKHRHDGHFKPRQENETPMYPPLNRCSQYSDKSHVVAIDGIKNLYEKFLYFKYFFALSKPLIFCEGETDNIYLKCAIRQLLEAFPSLAERSDKGVEFKIKFFKRTDVNANMLKLAEGASGMKFIALRYSRFMSKFRCRGLAHPVIMLTDNDKAGNELITGARATEVHSDVFYVSQNLYIVRIPKLSEKATVIEDYFDQGTLEKKIGGKSFSRANKHDNKSHYGKKIFASAVVQKGQKEINFEKFKSILNLLLWVHSDYSTRKVEI
ncbi:retron Ec67 family RNA-directed DNA polymerase/endonuclease [Bdellovibrio bacteriovorus]|uniref:retron Ec67 family RNA-directed DNA polymerase/endonuclease n=1 Tax=Bdellovibrio bacteriovorus TaxID=959 RepID=UPI003AA8C8CE